MSRGSTLSKAAKIGGAAFVGYQIGKVTGRFGHWSHGGYWRFGDWNRWRMEDGLLCRNNDDCTWLDPDLRCERYDIGWRYNSGWYDGDTLSIVGSCDCPMGQWWSDDQLQCLSPRGLSGVAIFFIVVGVIIGLLCLTGCCIYACRILR